MLPQCFESCLMEPESLRETGIRRTGRICGKFQNSFNVEFSAMQNNGETSFLLHVGSLSRPLCCFGLSVAAEEMERLLLSCEEGSAVTFKCGKLMVYGRGVQFRMDLADRAGFKRKNLRIKENGISGVSTAAGLKTEYENGIFGLLKREIEGGGWQGRMGLSWDNDFRKYAAVLAGRSGAADKQKAAVYFAGRGRGLTPGGDDILLGYAAVMKAAGQEEVFSLSEYLPLQLRLGTTAVSRAYFRALDDGFVNEDFRDFLLCIFEGGENRAEEVIKRIKGLGHTSGHDTLFGAYLALIRLIEQDRKE